MRAILLLGSVLLASATAAAATVSAAEQAALSMTVYQQGVALVRDERTVELGLGRARLEVLDVSDQIIPQSVLLSGQGLVLHGAGYSGVSLTSRNLLTHYVGKSVRVVYRQPPAGSPAEQEGVLLSAAGGIPIVKIGERVEIGGESAPWTLAFDSAPDALRGQPALTLDLENTTRGPQSLVMTYLTEGLSWQADYVGVLQNGNTLLFSGWVSLENKTDTAYSAARVQLLAGDVHQPDEVRPMRERMSIAQAQQADLRSDSVQDYHLYSLPEPISLLPAQRRQVPLLAPRQVPVEREYRVSSEAFRHAPEEEAVPVTVRLKLPNAEPVLGRPLPAGVVRVYSEGPQDNTQYLGADRIDHTPKGGEVTLRVGSAFDVSAKRTTLSFRRMDPQTAELEQRVVLRNQKDQPVTVTVAEQLPGDWQIQSSSHPHSRASAHVAEWRIEVPADGESTLSYRARVQY